jgi:hypothetical protein
MRGRFERLVSVGAIGLMMLAWLAMPARADFVQVTGPDLAGSRSTDNSAELVVNPVDRGWASGKFTISWRITEEAAGLYDYHYWVTTPLAGGNGLSHWILGFSENFAFVDFVSGPNCSGCTVEGPEETTAHSGNPGMPDAGIFGVRWTPPDPKPNPFEVQFTSYRVPIWGDFYAKDGGGTGEGAVYAYNAGFGYDWSAGEPGWDDWKVGFIPTPDTVTRVPEPASILGLGTVLLLVGSRLKRRKA